MAVNVEDIADVVANGVELVMMAVIAVGSFRAIVAIVSQIAKRQPLAPAVREIWLHYAAWILLALEFAVAADLIRTVVAPSWKDIGQLGAIAAIRTALAYFLGKDITEFRSESRTASVDCH
jgi:uncharacterized membrane protein